MSRAEVSSHPAMSSGASLRKPGLTLIELLVLLAIVGLLLALLSPAVQSAREAARRMHCVSRMRQLGLGIQAYESAFQVYPPSHVTSPHRHGLLTFLLMHVEQTLVADQYDWGADWNAPENHVATHREISVFRCPSAPRSYGPGADFAACTNLVSPARRELLSARQVTPRKSWLSVLQPRRSTVSMVRDGLSNSLLLFEDGGRPARFVARKRARGTTSGAAWADSASAFEIHYLCRGSSLMNCRNDNEIYSFHPQGCNFLFADGSCRFLVQEIEPDHFVSLFTRAGRDVSR